MNSRRVRSPQDKTSGRVGTIGVGGRALEGYMAKRRRRSPLTWDGVFNVGGGLLGIIVALATFVTAWTYCTIHYGFLFGFGLGWLPAGILAAIAGAVSWLVSPLAAGLLLGSLLLICAVARSGTIGVARPHAFGGVGNMAPTQVRCRCRLAR